MTVSRTDVPEADRSAFRPPNESRIGKAAGREQSASETANSGSKSVLIIAYQFPPDTGSIQRITKFTHYLPEFGWQPVVISHALPEGMAEAPGMQAVEIVRAGKPAGLLTSLGNCVRAFLCKRGSTGAPAVSSAAPTAAAASLLHKALRGLRTYLAWPDEQAWWILHAFRAGLKRARRGDISVIYVVTTPHSASLAGCALKRMTGLPLVIDFRDPWANLAMPTPLHKVMTRCLEKLVFRCADRIVTTTKCHADYVRSRLPEGQRGKVATITNGYDPTDFPSVLPEASQEFVITHAGGFYGTRTPDSFFRALALVFQRKPELRGRIRVRLIGEKQPIVTAEGAALGLESAVEWAGYMDHARTLTEMARSSVLLLVVHNDPVIACHAIPAKLFEYMASRRPVLAISPDGVAAELVRSTGCGIVHGHHEVEEIAQTIMSFYSQHQRNALRSNISEVDLRRFQRRSLTEAMAGVFEDSAAAGSTETTKCSLKATHS